MARYVKKRYWAFVVYPDSAPQNWREILAQTGLLCAISPLHDRDVNPDNTPKKPHYHVITCFSGPTTFNTVKALTDSLNQPIPQPLESVKGYFRYLTHKDNPEKAQYSESEIQCLNGFSISDFDELTRAEIMKIKRSLMDFVREKAILEYATLIEMLLDAEMFLELDIASSHTLFFDRYISSRRHRLDRVVFNEKLGVKIDKITGEIVD